MHNQLAVIWQEPSIQSNNNANNKKKSTKKDIK
jgi:hypothetical protein